MLSTAIARTLDRRGIHYGWVVAGVTFLTMLSTAGAMGSAGVLIKPLTEEFGWTTAQISSALAVRLVLFGLLGPFAAAMMNAFGLRAVLVVALSLIGGGVLGSFFMSTLWQLVLCWGVIVGVGTGMTALVLGATVAARWFTRRRGSGGRPDDGVERDRAAAVPADDRRLTELVGWRSAMTVVVVLLAAALGLALLLIRDYPSRCRPAAAGRGAGAAAPGAGPAASARC